MGQNRIREGGGPKNPKNVGHYLCMLVMLIEYWKKCKNNYLGNHIIRILANGP